MSIGLRLVAVCNDIFQCKTWLTLLAFVSRIPIQMISWSIVASFQAFLSGKASFWVCRALLGMIEGGFIADNIL
jgi:hypothetical protein